VKPSLPPTTPLLDSQDHEGLQIDLKEGRGDICRRCVFCELKFRRRLLSLLRNHPQSFGKRCTDLSWFSFPSRSDHLLLRFQSAQHISTGENVAIKCMKSSYTSTDEVAKLREIQVEDCSPRFGYFLRVLTFAVTQAIKKLSPHPSIVKLHEVLFDPPSGRLALVFESVRFIPYRGLSLNTYSRSLVFSLSRKVDGGQSLRVDER